LSIKKETLTLSIYEMCRDHLKKNFNDTPFTKEEIYSILFSLKLLFRNNEIDENTNDMESTMEDISSSSSSIFEEESSQSNYESKSSRVGKKTKIVLKQLKKYDVLIDWSIYESKIVDFHSNKIPLDLLDKRREKYVNFYRQIPIKTTDLEQYLNLLNKRGETSIKNYNSNFHIWAAALEIFGELTDFDIDSKEHKEMFSYIFEISKDPMSYKTFNSYIINPSDFIIKKEIDEKGEEQIQSFIINPTELIQTKSKPIQRKGKYGRINDYIVDGNNAIWDTDSLMLTNPTIDYSNINYDEYELALYNKLKNNINI